MNGYEKFDMRFWNEHGITVHPPKMEKVCARKRRNEKWRVIFGAGALVILLNSSLQGKLVPEETIATEHSRLTLPLVAPDANSEVPVGYWASVLHEMKGWQKVTESTPAIDLPDPFA